MEPEDSKLSEMILSVLFISELVIVICSVEEGFSHASSPWCNAPELSQ